MDPAVMQVLHHVLEARKRGDPQTVSLPGADLRGAQLPRADLVGANLSGAGMDHAVLAGAKLGGANLRAVLLRWADLNGADLTGADLRDSDLSWVRVEGACLADADLRGATLVEAVGEPANIAGLRIDKATAERSRLPDDEVIQLWRNGAVIDDVELFSEVVQVACSPESADAASEAGPPTRKLADVERGASRHRLKQDDEIPPSSRAIDDVIRISLPAPDGEPSSTMPMRSLQLVDETPTPALLQAPEWKEGDEVLGVTIGRKIGDGNSARVWSAKTSDGEDVALKCFRAERASVGLSLPAYRRGVAVMNRLTACGDAVKAVELHCCSLNKLGFVMDLAENGSAVDLPALKWPVKSAVDFFEKLCEAVGDAHSVGALHRCLKPANILLDEELNPLLTDFDMVDLPSLAAADFQAGGYMQYAAPEELLAIGTQSPTADIFSLGRFLHFLLLGKDPEEKITDVPELDALRSQPAGLTRIIRKCTMRAPERRYQFVAELLEDVRNYEDYDQVGIAGGASEHNYLPYRVSSLSHETPWLRSEEEPPKSEPKPSKKKPRKRRRRGPPSAEPLWTRKHDRILGAVGVAALVVSVLAVKVAGTGATASMLSKMHLLSVLGGCAATFVIPRFANHGGVWRKLFIVGMAAALWFADVPSLVTPDGFVPPASGAAVK